MKQLYDTTRKLAGKYKQADRPIKDKKGDVFTGDGDQLKKWMEHFEDQHQRTHQQTRYSRSTAKDQASRLVNKCMSTHVNANVSLDSNANAIFRNALKCKCFGVTFKYNCFGYTFVNAFE